LCAALLGAGALGTSLVHTPTATAQAANRSALSAAAAKTAQAENEERGITEPSEMSELAFALPGVVIDVPVKLGNVVKKGQLLAQQDESVEKAGLIVRLQEKQEALLQITAAEKEYATKKVVFERQDKLLKSNNLTSQTEWETAKLDMEIAKVRGDLAKETVKKTDAQIEEQQIRIDLKKLVAPYDGIVKKIDADRGETGDPQKPAMVVVSNNPLWVKIDMPSEKAKHLKLGQELEVRYDGEAQAAKAKVIFLDPVVDAASDTRIVRLEMQNEANRESGLQVLVKLPAADRTSTAVAQPAAGK
jgi:RND family efflux transporter MFP subunit